MSLDTSKTIKKRDMSSVMEKFFQKGDFSEKLSNRKNTGSRSV